MLGIKGEWDKWVKLGIGGLIEAGEEVSNTVLSCLNKSDSSSSSAAHHAPNMPNFTHYRRGADARQALKQE
jgi:hypothetical protein